MRTRFLQTWLRPDEPGGVPSYARTDGIVTAGLTEVTGLGIGVAGARLGIGRVEPGGTVLPDAPRLHLFVVAGLVTLDGIELAPSDAVRISDRGGDVLHSEDGASVAVWAFGT